MARIDIFIKVNIESEEQPERLAAEICRHVQRVYGVRSAEMVNYVVEE